MESSQPLDTVALTSPAAAPDTAGTILDAALAETLAHGIRRTTMSDIARRSGLSRQTVYRYWPDAQSLFASLVTREVIAQLPADARPDSREELVALLVDAADRVRGLAIVDRLRDTDPELFARYILGRLGTSQRHVHAALTSLISFGQVRGFVGAGEATQRAAMLLLVLQSAVQSAPLVAEWLDDDAWRDELAAAVGGVLAVRA